MEPGNATSVAPDANPAESNGASPDSQPLEQQLAELKAKSALLEEKYSNSSREAHRLVEENKALKVAQDQAKQIEPKGNAEFIDETSYVKFWVDNGDKTENEARREYAREKAFFENQRYLDTRITALNNRLQFTSEQQERSLVETSPAAKEAAEFFKGMPQFENMPALEKIDAHKAFKERLGIKPVGRDLSQVKANASGPTGSSGGSANETPSAHLDEMAKKDGYPSWRAMQEYEKVTTQAEHQAFMAKWKLGKK